MLKKILIILVGFGLGIFCVIFVLRYYANSFPTANVILSPLGLDKSEVLGFLPYWLINKSEKDYSSYLTNISYFGLTVDSNGSILKLTNPTETDPGWLALKSEKISKIINGNGNKNLKRSLVIFNGDQDSIGQLIDNPTDHGDNLITEISPIISKYKFKEVNIDIESVTTASESARQNFTLFMKTVHERLKKNNNLITLSIDVSPIALIKPYLIDITAVAPYVDKVIFMTYDFHYQGSMVTGAVSPESGAGKSAEFDTETSIKETLKILDPKKIILGAPLYGYEWETLSDHPHAGVIPGSGIVASNARVEKFMTACASCSAQFDPVSKESYFIYKDQETNTFHQFFYPDKKAMQEKVNLVKKYHLGGIALWALGYEGDTILEPLKNL